MAGSRVGLELENRETDSIHYTPIKFIRNLFKTHGLDKFGEFESDFRIRVLSSIHKSSFDFEF